MKTWTERLYFGTWQLGGDFGNLPVKKAAELLENAWDSGIRRFDTAAVYGRGSVENIIGATLPVDAFVLTKIPALSKPRDDLIERSTDLYSEIWIEQQVVFSLERLQRSSIDTLLLHNWKKEWLADENLLPLKHLERLRQQGVIKRFGISLRDGFSISLTDEILDLVDVIEAPLSKHETWIVRDLPRLKDRNIEVIARSIFLQGMLLKTDKQLAELDSQDIRRARFKTPLLNGGLLATELLQEVWDRGTSIVVGMTTIEQIRENIAVITGIGANY